MTDRPLGGEARSDETVEDHEPLGVRSHRVSGGPSDPSRADGTDPSLGRSVRKRALVVDDSHDMRSLLDDVLSAHGYEVTSAASGGQAMNLLVEHRPDVVITDLVMPGMSGFALRGEMLRRPDFAGIPVIVLSAFWQRPSETLEVAAVLSKPLDVDGLIRAVRDATSGTPSAPAAEITGQRAAEAAS